MGKQHGLRMAKASQNDLHDMMLANHILEVCFDKRGINDFDSLSFKDFEHLIYEEYPNDRTYIKNMFKDGELSAERVLKAISGLFSAGSHGRVVIGCDILINNCCDQNIDHLEFKPVLKYSDELLECCQEWLNLYQNNESNTSLSQRTIKALGVISGILPNNNEDDEGLVV